MASLTPLRQLDVFALDSTNGIQVEEWSDTILQDSKFAGRLDGRGALFQRDSWEGREIRMSGTLYGADEGEARDRWDLFTRQLMQGEQYLQLWHDRRIAVRLAGDIKRDPAPGSRMTHWRWRAQLRSRYSTWEALSLTADLKVVASSPATHTMSAITGTAPAWPVVQVVNNGAQFDGKSIVMTAGSKQVALSGLSMSNGQNLTIDFREGLLDMAGGQPPRPVTVEGGFFSLDAGVAPTWEFVTDVLSPNIWISIQYRAQYWEA